MNIRNGAAIVFLAMAGIGFEAGADPTVRMDNFNDGVRNTALWKAPDHDDGLLTETGGHLYYNTLGVDPNADHSAALWWKGTYTPSGSGIVETEVLVRMRDGITQASGETIYAGFGWLKKPSGGVVYLTVSESGTQRNFFIQCQGPSNPLNFLRSVPVPATAGKVVLKMRYVAATRMLSFWWRLPTDGVWNKIGKAVNLNDRWVEPGLISFQPFVSCSADGVLVPPSAGVYLDNFGVTTY